MKSLLLALTLVFGVCTFSQNADAKPQDTASSSNQAATLTTEAATIYNNWNTTTEENNNTPSGTIALERDLACEKKGVLEYIENPEALFKDCSAAQQRNRLNALEEELKPPKLESGLSVTVTNF